MKRFFEKNARPAWPRRLQLTCGWLGLLVAITAMPAQAITQEIRAVFRPDSANPGNNAFINQTPVSGYCADYPAECKANGMFSIRLPINFHSRYSIRPGHSQREGPMFTVPSGWGPITVTNNETGETETVEFRISGLGTQYVLSDTAQNLTGAATAIDGHVKLWGSDWVYAPPPCQYSGVAFYSDTTYRFFWKTPVYGACSKTASFLIPSFYYRTLDFAYELRTPNPLGMSSGQYTTNTYFGIGPGGAFDMGDAMIPDDSSLIINFVLDVQHTLKVDLPPGGNRIALEPEGGWQRWLNSGRPPERLFRDQTFHISASSRFKMYLECGSGTTTACGIWNDGTNHGAPMLISVTLPDGLTDTGGQPVKRQELFPLESRAIVFQPGVYVDRKPGTLHFEIDKANTERIVKADRGNRYSSTVVVIWDSEI